ncbi:MAG: hypothetical protein IT204_18235 [Fimbriimonadaceae bacterium]|nr:hypothetical protein [Fimbriimonadaceae bacterium]
MIRGAILVGLLTALLDPVGAATLAEKQSLPFEQVRAQLAQPPQHYAPFVFWFWDEPLDQPKLTAMATRLAAQGFNPGYAHPRTTAPGVGRQRPLPPEQWLSPDWFDCFRSALGAAEAAGAQLGFCDEYMWPSFQAAGRVVAQHPELRATSLDWTTHDLAEGQAVEVPACAFAVAARLLDPPAAVEPGPVPLGAWIWTPTGQAQRHEAWFRGTWDLPATGDAPAELRITCDNRWAVWVNGRELGQGDDWSAPQTFDVAAALRPGRNVVAVRGGGDGGLDALTVGLRVRRRGQADLLLGTSGRWRVSDHEAPGWQTPEFDDTAWALARVVSTDPGASPWQLTTRGPHQPARIEGRSSRLVSGGEPTTWTSPAGAWRVYVFHVKQLGGPNYLDQRLPAVFQQIALEPYAAALGEKLGRSVPGVFVDNEGQWGTRLAWSPTLAQRFEQDAGQDLRLALPLLLDVDGAGREAAVRWRWFEAVSSVYAETMGSTSRWLEQRGAYCIENLWEESLPWQAQYVGDFFKLSRAYTMPGNDCLGRKALEPHDFAEAASVAEFEDRRMMSEILGAGGWGPFTPSFMKQAVNAVVAFGVSHIVPHGVFTNRDLEGNVWTPDWYDGNPAFPWYRCWTDFARRACWVASQGRLVPQVLLVNPMDSVWARAPVAVFDPATPGDLFQTDGWWGQRVAQINAVYSRAIDDLTAAGVPFLVADRHYLSQMRCQDGALRRGDLRFETVVLPPLDLLPTATAAKLVEFAEAGGEVLTLGELPRGSAEVGWDDPALLALSARLRRAPRCRAVDQVRDLRGPLQFLAGEFPLLRRRLRIGGREVWWLANQTGLAQAAEVRIAGAHGRAEIWDCETGAIRGLPSVDSAAGSRLHLTFEPDEAYWLAFDPPAAPLPAAAPAPAAAVLRELPGPWQISLPDDAQPVLQFPVSLPPALRAGVTRPLGPWEEWLPPQFSGVLDYVLSFDLPTAPPGDAWLDLGVVLYAAAAELNGTSLGQRLWGPHRFATGPALRRGRNALRIRVANLINNSYGDPRSGGLLGPVCLTVGRPGPDVAPAGGTPVALANATADHSQPDYEVAGLLDDDPRSGWGAWDPALREPVAQTAVVETVESVGLPGRPTTLVFVIEQAYRPPDGLSLGRFRLAATTAPRETFADGRPNGGALGDQWQVLRPTVCHSQRGTPLLVQADGSVLAAFGPAGPDVYSIVCETALGGITGFRLEALEDDRLPTGPQRRTAGGPGRSAGEGNFTVTALRVSQR